MNRLSYVAKKLLISNIFFRAGNIITKIFVNIYILKSTGDLKIVAIFSLMLLLFHFISYCICSSLIKSGWRNRTHVLAIIGTIGVYGGFVFFPHYIGYYAWLAGGLLGVFSGMYWCVYNIHQFDFTLPKNRGNFEGLKKSLRTVVTLIVPVIAGGIIAADYGGYGYQSAFILGAIFYGITGFLGITPGYEKHGGKLQMGKLLQELVKHPDVWKICIMLTCISFALSLPLIEVVFPLIFFSRGLGEFGVGVVVSAVSIVSIISSYVFGKFVDYKYYKQSFILAALSYLVLLGILIVHPTEFIFGIFVSCVTFLYVFVDIPLSVFASNITHEIKDYKKLKEEFILFREFFVISGRLATFVIIYFLGSFSGMSLQILFTIMACLILLSIVLFYTTKVSHKD